jgi:20S proteasome alpha/beta subunit
MAEVRTVVPDEIDYYLDAMVRTGPFGSKAELIRAALVSYAQVTGPLAHGFDKEMIYSPDGRIYQIEYARESSRHGMPIAGLVAEEGVVLAGRSWDNPDDPLMKFRDQTGKIVRIGENIAIIGAGLVGDLAAVVRHLRGLKFSSAEDLMDKIKAYVWESTMHRDSRPLGITLLVATTFDGKPRLFHVDPSSSTCETTCDVFGAGDDAAKEILAKSYRRMPIKDAEALALKALGNPKEREVLRLMA